METFRNWDFDSTTNVAQHGGTRDYSNVLGSYVLGWKKSFEKLNTQITCEFTVTSQFLGGQF